MPRSRLRLLSRSDQFYPWLFFLLTSLLSIILLAVPWPILDFTEIMPNLTIIVLFLWLLLRPETAQYSVFFILGIVQDLCLFAPIGTHAVLNLLFLAAGLQIRPFIFAKSFVWIFAGFALCSVVYILLQTMLLGAYGGGIPPLLLAARLCSTWLGFVLLFSPCWWMLRSVVNWANTR